MSSSLRHGLLTVQDLRDILAERIVVFDGAMGTQLQARSLVAADFGGEALEGCNENLNRTRPDVIAAVHAAYYEAGADIVETNSFGSTPLVLAEYGLQDHALEISRAAGQIAREVADKFSANGKPRWVAGSIGPTTKTISVTGGVTFDELIEHYAIQAQGLLEGRVDILLMETCQDTLNIKAGLIGIRRAIEKLGLTRDQVPVMVSGTIEPMGTMLAGQSAEALATSLEHAGLLSIGLNCATGPDPMIDHIRAISDLAVEAVSCMPNAGLPDEDGRYNETPETLSRKLGRFCESGYINLVGSCCGSTPAHTRAIAEMAATFKPRERRRVRKPAVSGIDYLDLEQTKPVIVGERTNVIGSRMFKRLIVEGKFEEAAEIGRAQMRGGAHVIDVCLANPDRDEKSDVIQFLEILTKKVRAPIMIDSTSDEVIEAALKRCQGKAIINSINLEDGEERFEQVCPLIRQYGAAVVVGCIDEDKVQGMGVTRTRKLEIARRSFELLTTKYGIPAADIIFDPLVFPCGTGDEQYIGSARETIEGVRVIKAAFPECRTILGISNVSFGLPEAGREVLNTVFLHKNFEAGLDMAIVNSQKLERITHLPAEEIALCEALIDYTGEDPVGKFSEYFRGKTGKKNVVADRSGMPLDQRLAQCVIEGSKEGLIDDLNEALQKRTPLEIINGPLMDGMSEVGRLFGANQLIVAEVLQSAEVMKAAVAHLEPFMEKKDGATKGKMILATVKGDVHDIGKNLVDIILSNNGFEIVNLGIKVPPQDLIAAVEKHQPDMIGLSGLLVKSAQQMVTTADDLRAAGVKLPILVGGAALSEQFTYGRIATKYDGLVAYASDAMTGLALANRVVDRTQEDDFKKFIETKKASAKEREAQKALKASDDAETTPRVRLAIDHSAAAPAPPSLESQEINDAPIEEIWRLVNSAMLYNRHLGLKGKFEDLIARGDAKALELRAIIQNLEDEILRANSLRCRAVYRFYRAASSGDSLIILSESGSEILRFDFPRQTKGEGRCLADLVAPLDSGKRDYVAFFVTTCQGRVESVRAMAERLKNSGDYLKSHALQALAIETAEAMAEWLHQKLRAMWGFHDSPATTPMQLFRAEYRGKRYSFGYPACPRLEDQEKLWRLLDPQSKIGVELTEGFMMEPEASVSALVFHHPQAAYFSVGDVDSDS